MKVERYKRRHWAVYGEEEELVCVTVYKKGATNVARLLEEAASYQAKAQQAGVPSSRPIKNGTDASPF